MIDVLKKVDIFGFKFMGLDWFSIILMVWKIFEDFLVIDNVFLVNVYRKYMLWIFYNILWIKLLLVLWFYLFYF